MDTNPVSPAYQLEKLDKQGLYGAINTIVPLKAQKYISVTLMYYIFIHHT